MRPPQLTRLLVVVAALCLCALPAAGQDQPSSTQPNAASQVQPDSVNATPPQDQPSVPPSQRAEQDQTIVSLPTTLPLKRHHGYFRLTHRFARNLGRGSFGSLAEDLFSLDSGAIIGLEYRFALTSRLQAGVHRTILGKTINTFARYDVLDPQSSRVGLSIDGGIEGQDNLQQDYQPSISATLSHAVGNWLSVYATPTYVHNAHTATLIAEHEGHQHDTPGSGANDEDNPARDTWYVGLGSRVRIRPTAFVVGEVSPRVHGYTPDRATWAVGIEKETHGHVFQLNFGNSFNTTPGLVARGGDRSQVFMGFNISRRF